MPKDSIKRLASVLEKRMDIQFAQEDEARDNDRDYNSHTTNELIKFALEEAYQNGELDFLAPSTGELRAKLYAQSSFDLGSSDDDNYRMSIDAGLSNTDKTPYIALFKVNDALQVAHLKYGDYTEARNALATVSKLLEKQK